MLPEAYCGGRFKLYSVCWPISVTRAPVLSANDKLNI